MMMMITFDWCGELHCNRQSKKVSQMIAKNIISLTDSITNDVNDNVIIENGHFQIVTPLQVGRRHQRTFHHVLQTYIWVKLVLVHMIKRDNK